MVTLLLLLSPLFYPVLVVYSMNPIIRENMNVFINCITFAPLVSILVLIIFAFITEKTNWWLKIIEESINILSLKMENVITTREKLEEILKRLNEIHHLISMLWKTLWWYSFLWSRKNYIFIKENLSLKNKLLLSWIRELRIDIEENIAEQTSILQWWKTRLKNISDTEHMSEIQALQSTRLDHQIKQFEELQKVLVKI